MTWYVYLVRCSDDSLYCGISNCVEDRVQKHNLGKGAKYTRSRRPVVLVTRVSVDSKSDALKLEYQVKKRSRVDKIEFLNSFNK